MTEALKPQNHDDPLVKARKRQIFLAACRVLARKSFHQATVKEMALEAGLAAGSIYVYLQSKDDILLLLAESMIAELLEALPALRAQSKGARAVNSSPSCARRSTSSTVIARRSPSSTTKSATSPAGRNTALPSTR